MRIVIDGRGVQGWSDGLSNYIRHVVVELLRLDVENEYVVLMGSALRKDLARASLLDRPNLCPVTTRIPFMGLRQHFLIPLLTHRLGGSSIYHYPHFDLPVLAHRRSVVTIYDLNHISFTGYFDSLPTLKRLYCFWNTWLTLRLARHVITISNTTKSELLKRFRWVDPQRVSVIYFGLNDAFRTEPDRARLEEFRRGYRLGHDRFLLYVGTHRPHKNVGRLLEAYERLVRERVMPQKLLLVGSPGEQDRLSRMVAARGLVERVVVLGYLPEADLPMAYRVADAFVFCSLSEGFGMPLLEAMASGVPIVTSNFGALAEVAGEAAVQVDPFSVEAMADGIAQVVASRALRQELVARGLQRVKNFTWEDTARRTLEVYANVARRRDGQG